MEEDAHAGGIRYDKRNEIRNDKKAANTRTAALKKLREYLPSTYC